jgi:hypothetical protein
LGKLGKPKIGEIGEIGEMEAVGEDFQNWTQRGIAGLGKSSRVTLYDRIKINDLSIVICHTISYIRVLTMLRLARQIHVNRSLPTSIRNMSHFRVVEHTIRGQNIRERPGAVKSGHEQDIRLAVKQYIPLDNPSPQEGDVTLIGAHANGFPKVSHLSLSRRLTVGHWLRRNKGTV